jgi:hypothetical protein
VRLSFCYKILKRSSANRPNLIYSVRSKPDSKDDVVNDMVAFIRENHVGWPVRHHLYVQQESGWQSMFVSKILIKREQRAIIIGPTRS